MSSDKTIYIYLNRFDPITNEHLNLIDSCTGGPIVLLPNVDYSFLLYRTHMLSFLFPLYTTFEWFLFNRVAVEVKEPDSNA